MVRNEVHSNTYTLTHTHICSGANLQPAGYLVPGPRYLSVPVAGT